MFYFPAQHTLPWICHRVGSLYNLSYNLYSRVQYDPTLQHGNSTIWNADKTLNGQTYYRWTRYGASRIWHFEKAMAIRYPEFPRLLILISLTACMNQTESIRRHYREAVEFNKKVLTRESPHYSDLIMSTMASQVTRLTIVYTTVYLGTDQRKYQSSASLAFVRGIHRWPVHSPHKGPVTRKMFSFDDVIMQMILFAIKLFGDMYIPSNL